MSNLFIGTEAKVFCLLILAFFWIFGIKNPQPNRAKLKYVYAFSGAGNLLLIVQGFVSAFAEMAVVLGFVVGVCYALAAYSWGVYAFAIKQVKMRLLAKIALVAAALAVGDIAYFSSVYGAGAILYAATFAVMAAFVVSQYNQIKIDNLTKLYNRYGMDEEIREQLQQYEHDKNDSFCIIACDLDNFKHINDSWGHSEGDRALILIATALSRVSKMFGTEVFRIGGDEFVIITDTSEEETAREIMNAVKHELDNIDFRDDFDIKMSMGVALYDGVTPIDELLNNADKKLYQAKRNSKKESI